MTIKKYAGDKITGLSSDTKPTAIPDGATFYETDTGKVYIRTGAAWVQTNANTATYLGAANNTGNASGIYTNGVVNALSLSSSANVVTNTVYATNVSATNISGNLTGNVTAVTVSASANISLDNDKHLNFKTKNTSAYAYMVQQVDDNFVFYSTNSTYGQRAVWSIFANSDTSALNFSTPVNFSSNVQVLTANGSAGATNQVLTSNGSTVYWSSPGAASVNVQAQYTWTNLHTFSANVSFTGNGIGIASNTGAIYLGGISDANWKIARNAGVSTKWKYTNNTIDIVTANSNLEGMTIGQVGGNSYFETGYLGTFIAGNVTVGNSSVNVFANATSFVGNVVATAISGNLTGNVSAGYVNVSGQVNTATLYTSTSANLAAQYSSTNGFYPTSNSSGYELGNASSRWVLTAQGISSVGTILLAPAAASPITLGAVTSTGPIQVGLSTDNQTIAIANGATTSGNFKTISVGEKGAAGSQTNITVGSSLSNTLITVYANSTSFSGNVSAVNVTANLTGNVVATTVSGNLTGNVVATVVNATANVSVGANVSLNTSGVFVGNASQNVIVSSTQVVTNSVFFYPTSTVGNTSESATYYDSANHSLLIYADDPSTPLLVGQQMLTRVVNKTGSTLAFGTPVYINGVQGNRPTVAKAISNSTGFNVLGLVSTSAGIPNNGEGFVITQGLLYGINTSPFTAGASLYLGNTAGAITATQPAYPDWSSVIGQALNSTNNGKIYVDIQTNYLAPAPNTSVLIWDGKNQTSSNSFTFDYVNNLLYIGNSTVNTTIGLLNTAGTTTYLQIDGIANSSVDSVVVNHGNGANYGNSSADFAAYDSNGANSYNFVDMGINGPNWNLSTWTINGPSDGYVYTGNSNLSVGTANANYMNFFTGGTLAANERMRITPTGNVGIGNTAPTHRLRVDGNTSLAGNVSDVNVFAASNVNVTNISGNLTGNVVAVTISGNLTGNVAASTISGNLTGNVAASTISGNLTGNVSATTISASANITVGANLIITTANIAIGNATANIYANSTAFVGNTTGVHTGNVSATTLSGNLTGNVAATTISGNLTGNVAATTISGNLTGNVSSTVTSASANVTVGANVLINLSSFSVAGNTTTAPTATLTGAALNIGNTSITGTPQIVVANTTATTTINANFISTTSISGNLTGNVTATTISSGGGTIVANATGLYVNSTSLDLFMNSASGVWANGSWGNPGDVFTSNGSAVYWTAPTAAVNVAAQYTWTNTHSFSNTTASGNQVSGAVVMAGGLGVNGNIYTGGRVGFGNTTNISVVYTYYNSTTGTLDTVFG